MFEIDKIPAEIYDALVGKGIAKDDVLLGAYCDRNTEHEPCDVYLLATDSELLVLSGIFSRHTDEKGKHSVKTWIESDYRTYALASISRFNIEELVSSARFTAVNTNGEPVFITAMTNFCRTSMLLFKKYLDIIRREGSFSLHPADDPNTNRCPKCGHRYPEKNRKICPRCMEKGRLFRRISVFFLKYKGYLALSLFSLVAMTALSIWATNLSSGFFIENGGHDGEFYLPYFEEAFAYTRAHMYQSGEVGEVLSGQLTLEANGQVSAKIVALPEIEAYRHEIPESSYTNNTNP